MLNLFRILQSRKLQTTGLDHCIHRANSENAFQKECFLRHDKISYRNTLKHHRISMAQDMTGSGSVWHRLLRSSSPASLWCCSPNISTRTDWDLKIVTLATNMQHFKNVLETGLGCMMSQIHLYHSLSGTSGFCWGIESQWPNLWTDSIPKLPWLTLHRTS